MSASLVGSEMCTRDRSGQMALFYGDVQVSDAVDADAEGVYTLEYDTASGGVPVGSAVTLTARYVASGNMAEASAAIELTVHPKVVGLECPTPKGASRATASRSRPRRWAFWRARTLR